MRAPVLRPRTSAPDFGVQAGLRGTWAYDLRAQTKALLTATIMALTGITCGYLIAADQLVVVAAVLIAVVAVAMAVRAPGPFIALMLLVALNGVPAVDLSGRAGPLHIQDGAVIAMIAALLIWGRGATNAVDARLTRLATVWAACFVAWWVATLARTVLIDGVPFLKAAFFGKDFLYFAILLPVALRARLPRRSLRAGAILLGAGITAFAIGQILVSLSGARQSWLVHFQGAEVGGLTRVYSPMSDLVSVSLLFVLAQLLSKEGQRHRVVLSGLTALFLLAVILQFTRATYLALLVALVVAVLAYTARGGALTAVVFRAAMFTLAVSLVVIAANALNIGQHTKITAAVSSRIEAGVNSVSNTTGTFGYRRDVDRRMFTILGSDWPIGLGFLHPDARYVEGLPGGSIRNADTGVLNALMTIGVVGALFVYSPLIFAFGELVRRRGRVRAWRRERPPWLVHGGAAWITWLIVGSATLVVLFSVGGLVLTALVLAALARSGVQRALSPA